jgi:hypothetical protein
MVNAVPSSPHVAAQAGVPRSSPLAAVLPSPGSDRFRTGKPSSVPEVKTKVKYLGAFTTRSGMDAHAFNEPVERYLAKQQSSSSSDAIVDLTFSQTGLVVESAGQGSRFHPANQITYAGVAPLPGVYGFVVKVEEGYVCHLLSAYKVASSSAFETLQDAFNRLIASTH